MSSVHPTAATRATFHSMQWFTSTRVLTNIYLGTDKDKPQRRAAHQQSIQSGSHVEEVQYSLHTGRGHKAGEKDKGRKLLKLCSFSIGGKYQQT